ncbi:MAG: hypothetical protein P9L99_08000 [Candidatus Lernaella stagnicola]|nr:hypothetical protein [Candidatus Lernaella stagnicola]
MSLRQTLHLVAKARTRELVFRLGRAMSYCLPAGGLAAVAATFLYSLAVISRSALVVSIGVIAAAVLVAAVVYAAFGVSLSRLARLLDRRAGLKDRFTNALEFAARPQRSPLMDLAIADAEENAAATSAPALVPAWHASNWKRLATLALLLPLIYALAAFQLAGLFDKEEPDFLGSIKPPVPAELAEDGFRDLPETPMMLPAISGFRGALGNWRQRLTELRERARKLAQQRPSEEPQLPETIYREDLARAGRKRAPQILAIDGLPAVRETGNLHLSDARALGDIDGQIDVSMQQAFNELDQSSLDGDPRIQEVEEYINKLKEEGAKGRQQGKMTGLMSGFGANGPDADPMGAFRNATQGAQQESFNEFLEQYAAHLSRMIDAKRDVNAKRAARRGQQPGGKKKRILVADQGQQLPEDAELRMVKMTDEMQQGVKLDGDIGRQISPTEGKSKAGRGGGTFRGAIKVKHEDANGPGRKEVLKGKLGEGKTTMQILEDVEENNRATYNELLADYRKDALERLNDPTIPASVKAYVQRYLASIGSQKE